MKVSYVPYDETYAALFAFCQITLNPTDFGGNQGWDAALFGQAVVQAQDYLNDHMGEIPEDQLETYFNMLDSYTIFYWSTENYSQG